MTAAESVKLWRHRRRWLDRDRRRSQHDRMPSEPASAMPAQDDAPPSTHDAAGVDLTQIDMMLALTPRERLRFLYETASSLGRLMPDVETD